jgi:glycosyltransferase involved in cell wall biosynthesis
MRSGGGLEGNGRADASGGKHPASAPRGDGLSVAFDSRPQVDQRGIGRYVRHLLAALGRVAPGNLTETHRPRRADVFHSPWIDGALLRCPCPMVITLHDLVPLKRRGEYLRTGIRFGLRYLAVQRAVRVIVPTEAVAADAEEHLAIHQDRVRVIPSAQAECLRPRPEGEVAAVRKRYGLPERYLLWVGGLEHPDPRKRIAELTRVPRHLPLVLVGQTGPWAQELPDVTLTGHVSDDDLAAIYTGAHALTFPSDDEGFGLPTVEALACGTPVAACDVPALREVLGNRATFVARDDLPGLIAAAESARRPAPAPPAWTWDDAARATWDVYEDAAHTRGPAVPRST